MKNPQLKRAYAEDEYTPNMISELVRCKKDPIYFMRTYIRIQHPTRGTILFALFEYQEKFVTYARKSIYDYSSTASVR